MVQIGMRGHDLPAGSIRELGEACRELGIETIQLALTKSIPEVDWRPGLFSPGFANQIRRALAGVHVSVLGCYINPVDPAVRAQGLKLFREHLKFAKFIGADMIGTETGWLPGDPEGTRSEETFQSLLDSMRPVVRQAEALGVMVGIEPVSQHTLYCPQRMRRFLDEIDSPNVLVIFDPVNLIDSTNYERQRELMQECFTLFGDRISVVHLKDFAIEHGKKTGLLAGDGLLDDAFLFAWLKENKPEIELILEEVGKDSFPAYRDGVISRFQRVR